MTDSPTQTLELLLKIKKFNWEIYYDLQYSKLFAETAKFYSESPNAEGLTHAIAAAQAMLDVEQKSKAVDANVETEPLQAQAEEVKAETEEVKAETEEIKAETEEIKAETEEVKAEPMKIDE